MLYLLCFLWLILAASRDSLDRTARALNVRESDCDDFFDVVRLERPRTSTEVDVLCSTLLTATR